VLSKREDAAHLLSSEMPSARAFFSAGWCFDRNLQVGDWPMTETFGRAEMVRRFRGIDPFKPTDFGVTGSIFLEISVDSAEFSRKMSP
jgi:hypothetical protein